jgi:hypothetical protein
MFFRFIPFFLLLLHTAVFSQERTALPRNYTAAKTAAAPIIDGRIGSKEWKSAKWTEYFSDISTSDKPLQKTRVKMLWDDQYLYIAAQLQETDLWATLKNHDDIIFKDNDFEVFIDPNDDATNYFEIEINAFGTVMDLFMHKTYKRGGPMDMAWDIRGMRSAVYCKGSLNDNSDKDKYWSIEMAIPYTSLERPGRKHLPKEGDTWRINFSRVQWQLKPEGSSYIKKTNSDGSRIPEFNWVWSPQGAIDMHIPERWGYLRFSKGKK